MRRSDSRRERRKGREGEGGKGRVGVGVGMGRLMLLRKGRGGDREEVGREGGGRRDFFLLTNRTETN